MKHEIAMTQNVRRFMGVLRELHDRPPGLEGMGILWGRPGEGKSTTIAYAQAQTGGIFLRATAAWTMTALLQQLMRELQLPVQRHRQPMIEAAVESLAHHPRPIFVDEADYLLRDGGVMLDVLRDVYDLAGSPLILIGMEEFARRLTLFGSGRFRRRVSHWTEFTGLVLADTRLVVDTLAEVQVADDLVSHLHHKCQGNIGRMVVGIARIEAFALQNNLDCVALADFGRTRPLYLDVAPRGGRRVA